MQQQVLLKYQAPNCFSILGEEHKSSVGLKSQPTHQPVATSTTVLPNPLLRPCCFHIMTSKVMNTQVGRKSSQLRKREHLRSTWMQHYFTPSLPPVGPLLFTQASSELGYFLKLWRAPHRTTDTLFNCFLNLLVRFHLFFPPLKVFPCPDRGSKDGGCHIRYRSDHPHQQNGRKPIGHLHQQFIMTHMYVYC